MSMITISKKGTQNHNKKEERTSLLEKMATMGKSKVNYKMVKIIEATK